MPEIIDLNPIFTGEKKTLTHTFDFLPEVLVSDITLAHPLHVTVTVYEKASAGTNGAESLVEGTLRIDGEYKTACARCLKELTLPVKTENTCTVVLKSEGGDAENESESESERDVLFAPDGKLDADAAADALFFMLLPAKHLCREDCKGLCPGCGADLNFEKCTCPKKNIDPRLAVLQKYLDKSEN